MEPYNSNDWSHDPYGESARGLGADYGATSRPKGSNLPLEQISISRPDPPADITAGAIPQAWEYVKQYPGQTIVMSILTLMFNGGGNFNMPSNFGNSGGSSSSDWESYDTGSGTGYDPGSYDYGSWFDGSRIVSQFGEMFSGLGGQGGGLAGSLGGAEIAIIAAVVAVVVVISLVMFLIGTFVRIGATSMMLRIVRGQNNTFGDAFKGAGSFFLPMLGTSFLAGLGIFGGALLCLIPGIILTYGFFFVSQMVVDKNIPYVDALKASWQLTDGHKLNLFVFSILLVLLNIAGLFACCMGVVVTNAIGLVAIAIVYDRLATPGNAYLDSGEGVANVFE